MAGIKTVHHHGSHRRLIWPVDEPTPPVRVDAIIVPTARPVDYLKEAAAAALALRCPLVTLHSQNSSAYRAVRQLDPGIDLIAIDLPESVHLQLPELKTSQLLAGTIFERQTDVSTKRNLALLLSHMLRWNRVVFLDDDIQVPEPGDLIKAVSLLDTHIAVGLGIGGFPDNSTVCHAFRDAGGSQDTFIGAGALAVDVKRNRTFFPNVYNEDWFFVLDAGKRLQPVATVGRALQAPYDPYRPERARAQELGDVLAEGTFWLLDQDRSASDGDLAYWQDFLAKREKFIEQVLVMVGHKPTIGPAERVRMTEALLAARERLKQIGPGLCVSYLKALVVDQGQWQRHIQGVRRQKKLRLEVALESLARGSGTPLPWCTKKADPPEQPGATRGHRPRVTMVPRWRRVQASELQAAIPPPPPALVPRVFTAARRALPRRARGGVNSSHAAHAQVAADVAPAGDQGYAENNGHHDESPSQQLHA